MKTILRLKQCVLILVAAVAMTSCLKSDDPVFQVAGEVRYIAQEIDDLGESTFVPIALTQSNDYMKTCTVNAPDGTDIPMTNQTNYFQTNATLMLMNPFTTAPTGTYQISATNQEGEVATNSMTANVSKTMKTKLISKITYNSSTREVEVTFNKVENADAYQILLEKNRYDAVFSILKSWSESDVNTATDRTLKFTFGENDLDGLTGTFRLVTTAVITQTVGSYTVPLVCQQGDYTTLTK